MTCRHLTLEEYAALPDEDGFRDELSRGLLVRKPQPGYVHGHVAAAVYDLLRTQQGKTLTTTGFLLSRDPPTVRGPDVAFLLPEHIPSELPRLWLEGAPDLAVEVLSPSNRPRDTDAKLRDYFDAGTPLVWVLDPRRHTVRVHDRTGDSRLLTEGDVLTGAPVLPDLRVRVGDLFRI